MDDGTVAVEIAADQALVQWPFMTDMSLVDALVRVFQLPPALLESQMPNTTDGLNPDQARPGAQAHLWSWHFRSQKSVVPVCGGCLIKASMPPAAPHSASSVTGRKLCWRNACYTMAALSAETSLPPSCDSAGEASKARPGGVRDGR